MCMPKYSTYASKPSKSNSKTGIMVSNEYLRKSLRFFGGPGYDRGKRDRFVEEMRKRDSSIVLSRLAELFTDPDLDIRANTIEAALHIDKELGLDLVMPMLRHPEWDMRYHICGLMKKFGDQRATKPLLEILKNDSDPQVRGAAAFGLGGIGDLTAMPDLVKIADNDHEIDRLGYAPSQSARQAIHYILLGQVIAHLTSNPDVKIRQTYATGGHLKGKIIHLPHPIQWEGIQQYLSRDTFEYTTAQHIQAESLHPLPLLVEITYRFAEIQAGRKFVFTNGDGHWAVGIYMLPESNDG
jgi:hypothetical protein